ncbi:uncharacterized protein JCM15063_004258 [Sporobolomyces koalae]|uniref:uncharacterized protein n=1 Tax=Sporobolomyces koalae TaxID=500713 RepID=UPI00316E706D
MGRTPSHSSSALTKKTTSTASAHKTSSTEKGSSKPAPSVKRSEFLADVALAFIEKNDDIGMALCGEAHFTKGGAGPTQIQCMSKIAKTVSKDNDEYGLLWDDHDERKVLVESTSSWWKRRVFPFSFALELELFLLFG